MPYQKKEELPDAVKALPAHGQEIWMAAFNSAWEQYEGDASGPEGTPARREEKCFGTAWAAVKEKYRREEDKWIPFGDGEPWIEVFSTGWHTDSKGRKNFWTDSDLKEIATLYNPKHHRAPLTIGHPETGAPAYGWIAGVKYEDNKLLFMPEQVDPWLKEEVRKGHYKNVSIGIYPDLGIRHLGFLGAMPPAVKGLKQVTFSEKAAWVIESEFFMEPWQQEAMKSIFQRMRDWMIEKFGREEADKVIGSYDLDALKPAPEGSNINIAPSFIEGGKGGKSMDLKKFFSELSALITGAQKELVPDSPGGRFTEEDLAAAEKRGKDAQAAIVFAETEKLKKEKEDSDKKLKEIETKARKDGIAAFCEGFCKEGKLTPALRKIIEPVMIAVSDQSGPIEFSEGVKKPALDGIKDFLTELPKVVTFREVTPGSGPAAGGSAGEKLLAIVKKKRAENKNLSHASAFAEAQTENPELAKEYLDEVQPPAKR